MKVKELKEKLKDVNPDLQVYVFANHGQTAIQASDAGVEHMESLEYYSDFEGRSELKAFVVFE